MDNSYYCEHKNLCNLSLKTLGKKNMVLIMPCLSFPISKERDTGVGSPYTKSAQDFLLFLKGYGVNGIQLTPKGITSKGDASPYRSSIFSRHFLLIDLYALTRESWCRILNEEIFAGIVEGKPEGVGGDRISYEYAYAEYLKALKESYKVFTRKLTKVKRDGLGGAKEEGERLFKLGEEYKEFVKSNIDYLYSDGLYYVLSLKNGSDDWVYGWGEEDKALGKAVRGKLKSIGEGVVDVVLEERLRAIENEYREELKFYYFTQYIESKQSARFTKYAKAEGINIFGDSQVSPSDMDIWSNQEIFLEGYRMGVPPDYFSDKGQAWGFPVLDPAKLFNNVELSEKTEDKLSNNLGEGGEFVRKKFLRIFKESVGVRIDHIIGLIDPWVYKASDVEGGSVNGGRLYSSPDDNELSKYSHIDESKITQGYKERWAERRVSNLDEGEVKRYGQILEIIFSSGAEIHGSNYVLICEDLGTLTYPVIKVMERYALGGIRLTEFVNPEDKEHIYRGKNVSKKDWIIAGTHDNDTLIGFFESMSIEDRKKHARMLCEDLNIAIGEDGEREDIISSLSEDINEMVDLKLSELLFSEAENVQIMFTDMFKYKERYNMPSSVSESNWTLRLRSEHSVMYKNFSKDYVEGLGVIDFPKILENAIKGRGKAFVKDNAILLEHLKELRAKGRA